MANKAFVAFDLGAESGRAMLAILEDSKLTLEEAHRFANQPQPLPSGLHWNLTELWRNLLEGLKKAGEIAKQRDVKIVSLGVDTWGVDCGLIGKSGQLLGLPFAYRDNSHPPAMQKTLDKLGRDRIYQDTGLQFMPFNTLFQLVARHDAEPGMLDAAERMLFIPDLLHYFFSGQPVNEATIASTSQMIDPYTGKWHMKLVQDTGLPTHLLRNIVAAGTPIGALRQELANLVGLDSDIRVIVPGSHDTASAVAAVPVEPDNDSWAYLSSGTWSLMGAELDEPIVSEASRQADFTNERGVGNKIRFLKNIAGLWLVQQVRADYLKRGETYDYPTLTQMAEASEPFATLVDPGYEPFGSPGEMCAKIDAFAKQTHQPVPTTPGAYVRCCLESLAMTYRRTLENLEELLGRKLNVLHIVGGGGKNALLNQMTADAINRRVVVGPYEGTAIGNALTQAIGDGEIRDLAGLRQIVRNSFEPITVEPTGSASFEDPYKRYLALL